MKLGNLTEQLQAPVLALAGTALTACGGAPVDQMQASDARRHHQIETCNRNLNWTATTPDGDPTIDSSTERALLLIEHPFVLTLFEKFRFIDDPERFIEIATSGELGESLKFQEIEDSDVLELRVDDYRARIFQEGGGEIFLEVDEIRKGGNTALYVKLINSTDKSSSTSGVSKYTPNDGKITQVFIKRKLGSEVAQSWGWEVHPKASDWNNMREHIYTDTDGDGIFDDASIIQGIEGPHHEMVETHFKSHGRRWLLLDPAMINAKRAMREVKAQIRAAANDIGAIVDNKSLTTPDGKIYMPTPETEGDSVRIYEKNKGNSAQVTLHSEPHHRFEIVESTGVAVDCIGPEEEREWRATANVPGLRPEDWVCQASLITIQGIENSLFPLRPSDANSFLEIKAAVESITERVEEKLRIQIERGGSIPVQGQ